MSAIDDLLRDHPQVSLNVCRIKERVRIIATFTARIRSTEDGSGNTTLVAFHESAEQALLILIEKLGDHASPGLREYEETLREKYSREFWEGNTL